MEKYRKFLLKNNYARTTIRTYLSILKRYQNVWHNIFLIKKQLKAYEKYPNTANTHYAVIHAFMKFDNDKRIKALEQYQLPHKPNVYRAVFSKEFLYQKTQDLNDQKQVIIRFLFETGIRASELSRIINISRQTIVVKGKGNKMREIFHQKATTSLIKNFNISPKTLRVWVKKILGKQYSPHSIRRSHATHLLLNGANPKMVMLQLGHSKIETTYKYLQTSKKTNLEIYHQHF